MVELIAQFLDSLAYERGLSARTRQAYEADLAAFVAALAEQGLSSFGRVTREHVAHFLLEQRRKGLRASTVARRLVAIRIFFGFLCAEGVLSENVTGVMALPRKGLVLPRVLSEEEVARLLSSLPGEGSLEVRDRCMLELLYGCGLRVSELTSLRLGDVRLDEGCLRCIGKGDKQRVIPLGRQAVIWLERYVSVARGELARGREAQAALFLTRRGAPFTRQGVFDMLGKRARAAQLPQPVSPHVLRHCFASHLLAHGANVRAIQEMLGHADIATTQVYTHVDVGHVTRTHARFHPRHTSPEPPA